MLNINPTVPQIHKIIYNILKLSHCKICDSYFVVFAYRLNLWITLNRLLALNLKEHWLQKLSAFPKKVCGELGRGAQSEALRGKNKHCLSGVSEGPPSHMWAEAISPPAFRLGYVCDNVIGSHIRTCFSWEANAITSSGLYARGGQCGRDLTLVSAPCGRRLLSLCIGWAGIWVFGYMAGKWWNVKFLHFLLKGWE